MQLGFLVMQMDSFLLDVLWFGYKRLVSDSGQEGGPVIHDLLSRIELMQKISTALIKIIQT